MSFYHNEVGEYDRLHLAVALWHLCSLYHSGRSSRGYRILSRLKNAGLRMPREVNIGEFEEDELIEFRLFELLERNYSGEL